MNQSQNPPRTKDLHLGTISIRGAREHNLKNIDLDIPRDRFVVITGLSGSGKSSLAFDTLYAEGQRRYVESLSAYARQFMDQLEKPEVDSIEGLSPSIAIDQNSTSRNPRSTVGTVTEIYDFLRLLYARVGKPHCPNCNEPISSQSVQAMMERILQFPEKTAIAILAPIVRGRKGIYQKELNEFRAQGYSRVRIDGVNHDLSEELHLHRQKKHTIEVYIDRLRIKPGLEPRLQESLEMALKLSEGIARVETVDPGTPEILNFNEKFSCLSCGSSFMELEPRLFSFNSPYGACKHCEGLGFKNKLDPQFLIPDPRKSILEGAVEGIEPRFKEFFQQAFLAIVKHFDVDPKIPYEKLPQEVQKAILYGTDKEKISYSYKNLKRTNSAEKKVRKTFEGLIPYLERRYRETDRESLRLYIEEFMVSEVCPSCQGSRLRKEALCVTLNGLNIRDLSKLPVGQCLKKIQQFSLTEREKIIGERVLKEITERLQFLLDVGLDYLSLDRGVVTLSGGESQRIRLATQIGSHMVGVLYILDEPSIGLHPRDNDRLLKNLNRLCKAGNSVLVVEHDEETIRRADFVVDMGPGAGRHGGEVVVAGSPQEVIQNPRSLTGKFLSGTEKIAVPQNRKQSKNFLTLRGANAHNLRNIDVQIPLGVLVCVTGVSGSGKSTLVKDILYQWFRRRLYRSRTKIGSVGEIEGADQIDKVVHIDQKPIGRTPRSNPATYTGIFSLVREFFSRLPTSRMRGWKSGRFSFNVRGGRCEACQGNGLKKIEMHFLPDIYVHCEICGGKRYAPETLTARYGGASIADVLDMTVREAHEFFENIPMIRRKLKILLEVGMGYITLGQSAITLSGGEAQRMKLSRELAKRSTGKTLYILDEPTTGLHFADIRQLLQIFKRLVDQNNTLVVIEHNLDVVKCADYIIDLGPGGGDEGGVLVSFGTPEEVAQNKDSITGKFLRSYLVIN